MRPWNPNTKSAGRPGDWTPPLRQTVPAGAHCASAHWATEAGNEWWYFQWSWRTPDPVFKVTAFLKSNICLRDSFYRTLIGNHMQSIEWYHFQWPWMTSDMDFKVTTFFDIEFRKNRKNIVKTKLLLHNRKLYLTYGIALCLTDL